MNMKRIIIVVSFLLILLIGVIYGIIYFLNNYIIYIDSGIWGPSSKSTNVIAFSPDEKILACGAGKHIKLFDLTTNKTKDDLDMHTREVGFLVFSPNGNILASKDFDDEIILWDMTTRKAIHTFSRGSFNHVFSIYFSSDSKVFATEFHDGEYKCSDIVIWDVIAGEKIREIENIPYISTAVLSDNGKVIATKGKDIVKLFDMETGREIKAVKGNFKRSHCIALSPNGKFLAIGIEEGMGEDSFIKIWDVTTGNEICTPKSYDFTSVFSLRFSPDSRILAFKNINSIVKFIEVATGKEIRTLKLKNPFPPNYSIAFSPDGKFFASGNGDSSVTLLEVESGKKIHTYKWLTIDFRFCP